MQIASPRQTDNLVEPLFLERWSPRSFDRSAIDDGDLQTLFDAARWAPSSFNRQPWRFIYAHRDTPSWERFIDLLKPQNSGWARNGSVLILMASDTMIQFPGSPMPTPSHSHSFDAGAAWALFALQATRMGLAAHGLAGVDFERARTELGVPDDYRIEAGIVLGRAADKSLLPEPLQAREAPSGRNPVDSFAWEGRFGGVQAAG
ncbi:nitroreductase family protein [Sphingomonas bacterium]|uniref:nitroreductase family protein n=1 Tax=Sphingomonas bacterium TaxID=1895847 RepID=UPI0015752696|nr:nitroreductase family protein [Sphingomonas bacterium]